MEIREIYKKILYLLKKTDAGACIDIISLELHVYEISFIDYPDKSI